MDIFYTVALIVLFIWNLRLQSVVEGHYRAILKSGDITGAGLDNHEHRLKALERWES